MNRRNDGWRLAAILLLSLLLRIPSFLAPIWNVDEAGTAAVASVLMRGGVLYRDVADHRGPITDYVYAGIFLLCGKNNMAALHAVLAGLVAVLILVVHRLGLWTLGPRGALLAALMLAVMSTFSYGVSDMYAFHTEWLAALFSSLGVLLLVRALRGGGNWSGLASGACFALAIFSKQPAALDLMAALLFLGYWRVSAGAERTAGEGSKPDESRSGNVAGDLRSAVPAGSGDPRRASSGDPRRACCCGFGIASKTVLLVLVGAAVVSLAIVGYFAACGAWQDFLFHFYTYNVKVYGAAVPWRVKMFRFAYGFFDAAAPFNIGVVTLVGAGLCLGGWRRLSAPYEQTRQRFHVLLLLWAICSFLGACAAGRNFGHYWIQTAPSWCLLAAAAADAGWSAIEEAVERRGGAAPWRASLLSWSLLACVAAPGAKFLITDLSSASAPLRPWRISPKERILAQASEFIRANSGPEDKIFVWGFAPEFYVLADRDPGSRYVVCTFMTGLTPGSGDEPEVDTSDRIVPGTLELMLGDLERNEPVFVADCFQSGYGGKYRMEKFPRLKQLVEDRYVWLRRFADASGLSVDLYARKGAEAARAAR